MAFAKKYNKSNTRFTFKFEDEKKYDFKKIADIDDEVHPIKYIYTSDKGKFGEQAYIVTDDYVLTLPKHLLDDVKSMIKDDEAVTAINEGKAGFQRYCYDEEKKFYSVNWIDL